MAQARILDPEILIKEQTQILYDIKGKPAYALIPLKPQPRKRSVSEILAESASKAKRQGINLKDLLSELEKVRQELYEKYYA